MSVAFLALRCLIPVLWGTDVQWSLGMMRLDVLWLVLLLHLRLLVLGLVMVG